MINFTYHLLVDGSEDKWYIVWSDLSHYAGPYKTAGAAKGELTKLKRT